MGRWEDWVDWRSEDSFGHVTSEVAAGHPGEPASQPLDVWMWSLGVQYGIRNFLWVSLATNLA